MEAQAAPSARPRVGQNGEWVKREEDENLRENPMIPSKGPCVSRTLRRYCRRDGCQLLEGRWSQDEEDNAERRGKRTRRVWSNSSCKQLR
jgi:hypothetical protein